MGRGRAKAKQTKVARQLKYNSGGTDLERLRAELTGAPEPRSGSGSAPAPAPADGIDDLDADESYLDDPYAGDDEDGTAAAR